MTERHSVTPASFFFYLHKAQFKRSFPPKYLHHDLQLLFLGVHFFNDTTESAERTIIHLYSLTDYIRDVHLFCSILQFVNSTEYAGTTNVYDLGTPTTTIDLNAPKEPAAVKPVNQAGVAATTKPVTTEKKEVATVKTPPAKEPVKETAPAKAVATETEKKTVAPKAPADQYWVQVASVTSKANAENAKQVLLDNKIECEIFTHQDDSGVLYYRLRVGPYTTKTEAEYWQGLISSINDFADNQSYITNSAAKKVN